jgi:hypothetical protein
MTRPQAFSGASSMGGRQAGLCLVTLLAASMAAGAEFRTAQEIVGGAPAAQPIVVCPPKFTTPVFVPVEQLLHDPPPVTPEGWIIHNRPVNECINCVDDAETRAYKLYEYPLKLREYNTQIRLLQAEIALWQRKLANYKYFNKTGVLMVVVENGNLTLLAAQERLRNLRYERMLFLRLQNLEYQLKQGVPVEATVIVQ